MMFFYQIDEVLHMREPYGHIAILICVPFSDDHKKECEPGVKLFEGLTCNGSLGPSEIVFLTSGPVKYADDNPTVENVKMYFSSFARRTNAKSHCSLWLHSVFDEKMMILKDGRIPLSEISDMIGSLACCQTHIILHGPGSEKAVKALGGEGRVLIYSEKGDGSEKRWDPFDFPSIFRGDRIYYDLFQAERERLEKNGFNLIWLAEGPKLILL